jgi:tetratricopeptide (TPR) repeat protein
MSKADKADEPPNPEPPVWSDSRLLGTVRSSHADMMQQIRQRTGHNPAPLVQLAHLQPKRDNRIAWMGFQASENNQESNQSKIPSIALLPASPNAEDLLIEALVQGATASNKIALIQQLEAHLEQTEAPVLRAHYAQMLFESGMLDRALHQAYRAVEIQPCAITLLAHGRCLGWFEPERALEVLQQALQLAEATYGSLQVRCLQEIIASLIRLGRYDAASRWTDWTFETHLRQEKSGPVECSASEQADLLEVRKIASALGSRNVAPDFVVAGTGQGSDRIESKLAHVDLLLAHDDHAAALGCLEALWRQNQQRLHLAAIALRWVPLLIASDQVQTAFDVAQQTLELSAGLHPLLQRNAQLVHAIALTERDPVAGISALEQAVQAHAKPLDAINLARAGLCLARVCEALGQTDQARAALQSAHAGLAELSPTGHKMLGVLSKKPEMQEPVRAILELKFLGSSEARLDGVVIPLRRRFAEILTVLAMHPTGLSGEQLSLAIYGEHGTLECCKTELSRLRHLVPIHTRPYKIGVPVKADFLELATHLEQGQLEQAMHLHHGPLLPGSDAPAIVHQREHLSESLRRATLEQSNPEQLWHLAAHDENDLELWQRLLNLLRASDPRHAIVQTRVSGLRRAWNV